MQKEHLEKLESYLKSIGDRHTHVLCYDKVDRKRVDIPCVYEEEWGGESKAIMIDDESEWYECSWKDLELIDEKILNWPS